MPCVPTCTKGDLHRPLVGWLVGCESWCGGGVGALYCVHVVVPVVHCIVLEFPDSVLTQGQNHHVSVNCGASSYISGVHIGESYRRRQSVFCIVGILKCTCTYTQ